MIYENPSCGGIPGIAWGTVKVKLELLCCTTLLNFGIPAIQIVLVDNFFKPVIFVD